VGVIDGSKIAGQTEIQIFKQSGSFLGANEHHFTGANN
jgi:hypothetical protein